MEELLAQLQRSRTHFIHCVKPNLRAHPYEFSASLVRKQLQCLGTLDAVKLMARGFPTRVPYEQLRRRHLTLFASLPAADFDAVGRLPPRLFGRLLVAACSLPTTEFAQGHTMVLLKVSAARCKIGTLDAPTATTLIRRLALFLCCRRPPPRPSRVQRALWPVRRGGGTCRR